LNAATPPPRDFASPTSSAVVTNGMALLDRFPTIRNHIHQYPT
jgi:hypothetical protein